MKKEEKTALVDDLRARLDRASLALVSEYKGMTAGEAADVRRRLRAVRGENSVICAVPTGATPPIPRPPKKRAILNATGPEVAPAAALKRLKIATQMIIAGLRPARSPTRPKRTLPIIIPNKLALAMMPA